MTADRLRRDLAAIEAEQRWLDDESWRLMGLGADADAADLARWCQRSAAMRAAYERWLADWRLERPPLLN